MATETRKEALNRIAQMTYGKPYDECCWKQQNAIEVRYAAEQQQH